MPGQVLDVIERHALGQKIGNGRHPERMPKRPSLSYHIHPRNSRLDPLGKKLSHKGHYATRYAMFIRNLAGGGDTMIVMTLTPSYAADTPNDARSRSATNA